MATSAYQQRPRPTFHAPSYPQPPFTPPSSITPPSNDHFKTRCNPSSARHVGYVPAALRPTEMPLKQRRSITPPRSASNSLDSSQSSHTSFSADNSMPATPVDDFVATGVPREGLVSRIVSDEWNDELGKVTGAPTRNHWKPDSSASSCSTSSCGTTFSFFSRRHHCRRCGDIYCDSHSTRSIPLDQYARFHPDGAWQRACDKCRDDYEVWCETRKSRASSRAGSGTVTPLISPPIPGAEAFGIPQKPRVTPVVAGNESVADWNWSTF